MSRRTLVHEIEAEGIALHAGTPVRLTVSPAEAGSGIVFCRSDLGGHAILARYDRVGETRLGTAIDDGAGASVGVIEHLMAAVAGLEIDDLAVTVDGPEAPILDGDALSYVRLLREAGIVEVSAPRHVLRVEREVEVRDGDAKAILVPADARQFDFEIDFASAAIGSQRFSWTFTSGSFETEIAPARTFGFVHELEALNRKGLGRGATLDNTLAIEGDRIVNASLMRFADEFVRHKILDAIGDLALAGAPIIGRFVGYRSGHALNNRLLRALFSDGANFALVPG